MLYLIKDLENGTWWHETKKDLLRWAEELSATDKELDVDEVVDTIENYRGHDYEVELLA